MRKLEEGILPGSEIHFLDPSETAKKMLYCLQHIGVFYCDAHYAATHPYWESVLLLFVDRGKLDVTFREESFCVEENDAVIIDCRYPHHYKGHDGLSFHYLHFTGISAFAYSDLICQLNGGALLKGAATEMLDYTFRNMLQLTRAHNSIKNEHRISVLIHSMLSTLVEESVSISSAHNDSLDRAVRYMEDHLTESLSLDALADHVGLTKYYLAHMFTKSMGISPGRYFTNMRIQNAKRLLQTTHDSIEEIADRCGFDSASNFTRLFKNVTGMTPSAFRRIPL